MIATSGLLVALECTKFAFGQGCAQDPAGELIALPQTPSWFKRDPTTKGDGRGEGRGTPVTQILGSAPGEVSATKP